MLGKGPMLAFAVAFVGNHEGRDMFHTVSTDVRHIDPTAALPAAQIRRASIEDGKVSRPM
tara:strand:+ start:220 stop:399 length:180 start_codon:yes stop_codon:yes gene_type:complete